MFSRNPFQNVNRWFTTIINQPEVKSVIGNFKLCEKMAEFDAKKFADVQGKDYKTFPSLFYLGQM